MYAIRSYYARCQLALREPLALEIVGGSLSLGLQLDLVINAILQHVVAVARITSYNVCYTKLLRSPATRSSNKP